MSTWPGSPAPLGATWDGGGTSFAVVAGGATSVDLCLFDDDGVEERVRLSEQHGPIWHGYLPDVGPGTRYGYRVDGERRNELDVRNPAKLLLDPYAKAITGEVRWGASILDNDLDSAGDTARSVVIDPTFDWEGDRPPATSWSDTVLYEAHVKGLTRCHPGVADEWRGTYLGMGSPAVVEHLRSLGITAVELLPVHHFVSEGRLSEAGLTNYWGYNSLSFLAPHPAYAVGGDGVAAVAEFKTMVRALHRAGIEVILDVVYNHTAEGGPGGPVLSFRGLDAPAYYRIDPVDPGSYVDVTGCGNTLDTRDPYVLQLVMDSLRYWVTEMHVDGFRFDLASALARGDVDFDPSAAFLELVQQDPVVGRVKLIAEPWDATAEGYQVGNFPPLWSEWNGRYRDQVRDFWRGEPDSLGGLAERICGSSDLYDHDGRDPRASVNFVTCHDGFNLADLVSYDHKHNEANGEDNRDGTDDNRSWNSGVEGPTDDGAVNELRARRRRSFLATLFLSQGVPMLLAGDELGHSQGGTNNAYAQDNETTWIDWSKIDDSLLDFTRRLSDFRRAHAVLRRRRFLEGRPTRPGDRHDVAWFAPDGAFMAPEDWLGADPQAVGCFLNGGSITEPGPQGERVMDESLLSLWNGEPDDVTFTLPVGEFPANWSKVVDTAAGTVEAFSAYRAGEELVVPGRSVVVLVAAD